MKTTNMADKEAAKDGKDGKDGKATKTKESRKKIGLGR